MSRLTIRIDNHEQPYTVSQMRKRLAQVLSKLDGSQEVSFTFTAALENYQPTCKNSQCASQHTGIQKLMRSFD